jgi:hypothetical protein
MLIGSSDGAPSPSHTTGRALFRIRRLEQAPNNPPDPMASESPDGGVSHWKAAPVPARCQAPRKLSSTCSMRPRNPRLCSLRCSTASETCSNFHGSARARLSRSAFWAQDCFISPRRACHHLEQAQRLNAPVSPQDQSGRPKESTREPNLYRTPSRENGPSGLERLREVRQHPRREPCALAARARVCARGRSVMVVPTAPGPLSGGSSRPEGRPVIGLPAPQ